MNFFRPFLLERFFAAHEFSATHLLCASDCESISVGELLAFEAGSEAGLLDLRLGYTETRGAPSLRNDIAALYSRPEDGGPGMEGVLVHSGAEEAILNFCLATLSAGDKVIVNSPGYQSLSEIPRSLGATVLEWPLRQGAGRWFLDPDDLEGLLGEAPKLVIMNVPHNPTGALPTQDEFAAIIDLCRGAGVILLVDEVYRGLEGDPRRKLPPACGAYENGVSLNVLSKSAGLAGLRIGWLASRRADLLDAVAIVKDYNSICSSAPSEFLAGIALRNFSTITDRNRALCARNLLRIEAFVARHPDFMAWTRPEASSIGFPRLGLRAARDFGENAESMALSLLGDTGVLLLPGAYYEYDSSYFRIGYGRATTEASLDIVEEWVLAKGY